MEFVHAEKYYKQILERYPRLTEKQLDKIIKHGLRKLWYYSIRGDILIRQPFFTVFIGKIYVNKLLAARYRLIRKAIKYRMQYIKSKKPYNGKYYFGITKDVYTNEYLPQLKKNKRNKRRTMFFKELTFFKLREECMLHKDDYFFEIDIAEPVYGFRKKVSSVYIKDFRLIATSDENRNITFVSEKDKNETKRK